MAAASEDITQKYLTRGTVQGLVPNLIPMDGLQWAAAVSQGLLSKAQAVTATSEGV